MMASLAMAMAMAMVRVSASVAALWHIVHCGLLALHVSNDQLVLLSGLVILVYLAKLSILVSLVISN
jgi:hypothetical protein